MTQVRALKNFEYPESPEVRKAIRRHHRYSEEPFPWDKRGTPVNVETGQVFEAPYDLLQGWVENRLVEEVI